MADQFVSRGFVGKRRTDAAGVANRVPPGQYVTTDFPVLSAGPTPRTSLDHWTFKIDGLVTELLAYHGASSPPSRPATFLLTSTVSPNGPSWTRSGAV